MGNIDKIPFIINGDIQGYPTNAVPSFNQTCNWTIDPYFDNAIKIISNLTVPKRNNPFSEFYHEEYHTVIYNLAPDANGNRNVNVVSAPYNKTLIDVDYIEYIFDSPPSEKIYGFGLQYTETNFKGKRVNIATSEGGVGRGL